MIFLNSFLIFILGACLGSFSNVCIYRLPINKQIISGRSFCPRCKKIIKWFDNIPLISYLLLSGKCRKCHKDISLKYFIVEGICGISFVLIFLSYSNYTSIVFLSLLFLLYLIIFFIDLEHFIIPDSLSLTLMFLAISKNFIPNINASFIYDINQSIIGGMIGYLSIWIIIYIYRIIKKIEGMGFGDAKLMAGIGLLFGWQAVPFVLFAASILGLLYVAPSLINKKISLKSQIPFGPHIILGSLIYFLYGEILYNLVLKI